MFTKKLPRFSAISLAVIWIFGGAAFFFIRFSAIYYRANKAAIDDIVVKILEFINS